MTDFSQFATDWHHKDGKLWTLHQLHLLRTDFVLKHISLNDKTCIDLACGAGLMTEFMAQKGCLSFGYDISPELIKIAQARSHKIKPSPKYSLLDLEHDTPCKSADIIIASEIIEHIDKPIADFVAMLSRITHKGGYVVITSLNKTWLSNVIGIWLTEEILEWLPSGTHAHDKCVALDELLLAMQHNYELIGLQGMTYDIVQQKFVASSSVDVHYMCCFRKKNGTE